MNHAGQNKADYADGRYKLQRFLQPAYRFTDRSTGIFGTDSVVYVGAALIKSIEKIADDPESPLRQKDVMTKAKI